MQASQLRKPQNLAPIQSTAFDIYIANSQGIDYYAYFPKEEYKSQPQLNSFLQLDIGINHDIKYLRKLCSQINGGNEWYAIERPTESQLLSQLNKLEEPVIIKILSDLINSLFALHQRGTLGRCFNVNNILFVQQSYAVMMEFGFYPKLDYKVPEILYSYNECNYNEKIDIFLLGRVLFFLMVGKDIPQFTSSNYTNISNDIQVSIATTKYSEGLKKMAVSMLNWDAGKRLDFLQLISKFKNPQSALQEQFYRQPLSSSIIKLIEQREFKGQVNQNDMESVFLVEMTCNIEKIQKESIQGTHQKLVSHIQKGPQLGGSQQIKQNLSSDNDFLPPDIGTRQLDQQHIVSNVSESRTTTITQSQQVQEQKLRSSLVQNDIYLSILPYLNADRPNDCFIWNRIYFTQYRFSLLKKLTDQLTQYEKTIKQYMIPICIFALRKAQIILKKEFSTSLDTNQNIYEIEKKDWDLFVQKSEEFTRMKSKVKYELDIIVPQLSQNHYPQVKKVIDQFSRDQLMNELLQHTGNYLDDSLKYKNFEEIKKSFRYVLTNTLTLFDNIKDRQACQTKLLILMCILINRICDVQAVGQHFKTIQSFLKINEVTSIVEIELFFNRASENDYLSQFDELKSVYFSG